MELEHEFTVPVPVDEAWTVLLDLDRVAPCFPGATLTSHDDVEFAGTVKVKLGPITLLYKGSGRFTERDEAARKVIVEAAGKDSRGAGTAAAKVTATLQPDGSGTKVSVLTDLKITGRPAQLSRGLIGEVGGRLVQQFADCLARSIGAAHEPAAPPTPAGAASGAGSSSSLPGAAPSGSAAAGTTDTGTAAEKSTVDGKVGPAETAAEQGKAATGGPRLVRVPAESEPIDLLGAAGMPLVKRLLPALAGLALVIVLIAILRRRTRR